jgi:hypothetical protein
MFVMMKRILLLGTLIIGGVLVNKADAQVHVSVNIGAQPEWGPSGYDYAEYYYLPDIESYYYVPTRQFTYFYRGRWVTSAYLPPRYRNYNLYSGYKVVINERNPWSHFNDHRGRYANYRYRHDQVVLRDYRRNDGPHDRFRNDRRDDHRNRDDNGNYGRNDDRGRNDDHGRGHDRDRGHDRGRHDR